MNRTKRIELAVLCRQLAAAAWLVATAGVSGQVSTNIDKPTAPTTGEVARSAPELDSRGCHDDGVDEGLPPPAEDAPQPRIVCNHTQVFIDPVWRGTPVLFSFQIANEGDGPLILLLDRT